MHVEQAGVHSKPTVQQLKAWVRNPVWQVQQTVLIIWAGAGGLSVVVGHRLLPTFFQPHSVGSSDVFPFQSCICKYTRKRWNFEASEVGGSSLGWMKIYDFTTFSVNDANLTVFVHAPLCKGWLAAALETQWYPL